MQIPANDDQKGLFTVFQSTTGQSYLSTKQQHFAHLITTTQNTTIEKTYVEKTLMIALLASFSPITKVYIISDHDHLSEYQNFINTLNHNKEVLYFDKQNKNITTDITTNLDQDILTDEKLLLITSHFFEKETPHTQTFELIKKFAQDKIGYLLNISHEVLRKIPDIELLADQNTIYQINTTRQARSTCHDKIFYCKGIEPLIKENINDVTHETKLQFKPIIQSHQYILYTQSSLYDPSGYAQYTTNQLIQETKQNNLYSSILQLIMMLMSVVLMIATTAILIIAISYLILVVNRPTLILNTSFTTNELINSILLLVTGASLSSVGIYWSAKLFKMSINISIENI